MTNKELIYNEAQSPMIGVEENLNFRRVQLYIYRTVYDLIKQDLSRENLIAKLKALAAQMMFKSNNYFTFEINETATDIEMEFFITKHQMSRALFKITYDS